MKNKMQEELSRMPEVPESCALAYHQRLSFLLDRVNSKLASRQDLEDLIGPNPLNIMFDNHRNHAVFMDNVFQLGLTSLLVEIVPWVYRAYCNHGFSTDYFPVHLQAWRDTLKESLRPEDAKSLVQVYDWLPGFLTGLSNRSYFQERFTETFSLTKRHGLQFTLLLADLDHFKRINDTYGHDVGDTVLQTFGAILKRSCRAEDLPARYGGEEFMAMLPNTSAAGAIALHERLREELVHSNLLPGADYVTFSAGIVENWEGCTELSLLKKADDALYAAKNNGRDRYCIFP